MKKTEENLKEAFAGESMANRKYLAFARQAEAEGVHQAAKLFRAAAEAQTSHALDHLKALGMIRTTEENLRAAIEGETYEFTRMYPEFVENAKQEGAEPIARKLDLVGKAEAVHAHLYEKALQTLHSGETTDLYLCTVCGHIAEGEAPDRCPICGAKKQAYRKID